MTDDRIELEKLQAEASEIVAAVTDENAKFARVILAAMGGIPWVGGLISGMAALHAEEEQGRVNAYHLAWITEHEEKIRRLFAALQEIIRRVQELGEKAEQRLTDESYLGLVTQAFRVFDESSTEEKREFVRRLLKNAAGTDVSHDDIIRIFISWIAQYHERHFKIIRAVYKNPGITRFGIWVAIGGKTSPLPREDSSDADLFRMLIHDLSTGRVIRQHREVSHDGHFLKKTPAPRAPKGAASPYVTSSFEDEEPYQLSELGADFVHYVLNDSVRRLA